ncbi:MAG TPA: sulfotransferase [Vicinamibacterales bacterium]|nr:sulfotransferase [Vicinamibacterales bacterium]
MTYELNYSRLDRLLHRVAFAAPFVQLTAADIEGMVCGASYNAARAARPVFITSLPRAGTTLMLEALNHFPSLASHTYRDMPFVLAPVLWSRLSGPFRQTAELKERAHGDGMDVGFDSPEAFEEILWRTFWPHKYSNTGIALWRPEDSSRDGRGFFSSHMKKIVALRRPDRLNDGRYLSKNNANVARLALLGRMFPDAKILVPVRQPLAHARSLLRQHRNFLEMHEASPFVRRYMADLGHYEFGAVHRPIRFPGLDELVANRDPLTIDYWLAYWIAGFEHVLLHRDNVIVVSYESSCADPARAVEAICARLDVDDEGVGPTVAAFFKRDVPATKGGEDADRELLERAEQIHAALMAERLH